MTPISLAQLTVLHASPPELVRIAGKCGYDFVGLRLLDVVGGDGWPLSSDPSLLRETKEAMAEQGVGVLDVELAKLQPHTIVEDFLPFLETAAELGAKHVLAQAQDDDWPRLVDNFARLCDLAAPLGLTVDVEFVTWAGLRNLAGVRRLVEAAARPNGGITIDTLHFYRSGCLVSEIDSIDPSLLHFIQIADAPAQAPDSEEGLIFAAREDRLYPGEGDLGLLEILQRLPPETAVAVEIPNSRLARQFSDDERACHAFEATRRLVAQASANRAAG
jgi:sugar phosphate isomerase/epimerase